MPRQIVAREPESARSDLFHPHNRQFCPLSRCGPRTRQVVWNRRQPPDASVTAATSIPAVAPAAVMRMPCPRDTVYTVFWLY